MPLTGAGQAAPPSDKMQAAAIWIATAFLSLYGAFSLERGWQVLRTTWNTPTPVSHGMQMLVLVLGLYFMVVAVIGGGLVSASIRDLRQRRGRRYGLLGTWLLIAAAYNGFAQLERLLRTPPGTAADWIFLVFGLVYSAIMLLALRHRPALFRPFTFA